MVGNARYVRYIVIAFFVIAIVYFVSNTSDNVALRTPEMLGLRPSSSSSSSGSSSDSSSDPSGHTNSHTESSSDSQKAIKEGSTSGSTGSGSSGSSVFGSTTTSGGSAVDYPLAMSPNDPGFYAPVDTAPGPRMNATFVTLARNSDVWEVARSIRQVEDRFNKRYHYDWVFLNDKPFDEEFKKVTTSLISGTTHYGLIPPEHWSFPEFIDQDKAKKVREDMAKKKIIYGDSVSYRHMCRFESGFFFQQELMLNYDYYWRVEPSIEYFCDIHYDPFRYIHENNKKYSFVLSLYEYAETIPTLWDSVKKFIKEHPEHIAEDNSMRFLSDDDGETYNKCHFWSNFEIGNLNWLRSKAYTDFFESLDRDGGFFYERWGDAPVHSIAAGLLLPKEEIHFFNDIAYYHVPFTHCPTGEETRQQLRCHCNPKNNFDWKGYSCTSRFFDMNNMEKPDGWEKQS
ncbi:alpha 1,2-mannosyltransferase [Sporothrix schenckii 1099-18]|uniref:Alpha 1,2-mannosyltransferase n=1 Tax=Sporothrix schenckii 1099-18 TaxID=1397361 RepID=A0A0F2M6A6_SPOSC|nr:alpha 1,2-mannosyltransferase [Sporothrix schenckii 1099-18]KJR84335.1 alpha 1,2-mannosyltransferase [Sporothrix schenckii 1099-18]